MKDFIEKIKANKKMVAIAGIVILAIIIVAIVSSVAGNSYKKTIKDFAKAMSDESEMEKFVDKNVNLRATYAISKVEGEDNVDEEFTKEYKKAKKSDYMSDESKNDAYEFFKMFVTDEGEITVKKIGKLQDTDELNILTEKVEINGLKKASVTLEQDGEEIDADAYFYKGKLFVVMPDLSYVMNSMR